MCFYSEVLKQDQCLTMIVTCENMDSYRNFSSKSSLIYDMFQRKQGQQKDYVCNSNVNYEVPSVSYS